MCRVLFQQGARDLVPALRKGGEACGALLVESPVLDVLIAVTWSEPIAASYLVVMDRVNVE